MAKATIDITPEGDIPAGTFVTATLVAPGDTDELGNVTFNLESVLINSSVELGASRKASFYTQREGEIKLSFTGEDGKVLAKAKL